MSEFGGTPAGGRRLSDGQVRHVGMPDATLPYRRVVDQVRAIYLSGDRTGYSAPDGGWSWTGLLRQRFEDIGIEVRSYQDHLRSVGVSVIEVIEGPPGPPGPQGLQGPPGDEKVFIQTTDPGLTEAGVWIETTLSGNVRTVWVETGIP